MTDEIHLKTLLTDQDKTLDQRLALFAWLNLGILESLMSGVITASDAVRIFFNAENCLYVRQDLMDRTADEIMSHGVQVADLFDILPPDEAQREFERELATIRARCLSLLKEKRLAA
jgi:hypothetical protein